MNQFLHILITIVFIAAPLMTVTMGALISEYAGRMAMFLEYIINMGAFLCYAFTLLTGNLILGMAMSVISCMIMVLFFERTATCFKANMFLISLAMNMLFGAAITLLSSVIFETRGVLFSDSFKFSANTMKITTSIACYVFVAAQIIMLKFTTPGLIFRITGSDSGVLESHGISASKYKMLSWMIAAADGALCGCVLACRISSYVPGLSSGRGWTALAAVFFGKKNPLLVVFAVFIFAIAEWASTNIQNIDCFKNLPSSVLLALPYALALILIIAIPQKAQDKN